MDAPEQVVFLLQVIVNLAPIAVYVLVLGLVNSQAHPVLVNARSDFQILTLVFVPLLVWPMPFLVQTGLWWVLVVGVVVVASGFRHLLPPRASGWVLYNVSEADGLAFVRDAIQARGWTTRRAGRSIDIPTAGIRLELASFGLLRNVTLRVTPLAGRHVDGRQLDALEDELRGQLAQCSLLPSATGGCLMALGVSLLIVPLWLMSRNIYAIVEVVQRFLFA